MAAAIWRTFERHEAWRAVSCTRENTGKRRPARIATIAITTSSSISVKPRTGLRSTSLASSVEPGGARTPLTGPRSSGLRWSGQSLKVWDRTTFPPCTTVIVALLNATSATVAVQLLLGQPAWLEVGAVGFAVVTQNETLPFL